MPGQNGAGAVTLSATMRLPGVAQVPDRSLSWGCRTKTGLRSGAGSTCDQGRTGIAVYVITITGRTCRRSRRHRSAPSPRHRAASHPDRIAVGLRRTRTRKPCKVLQGLCGVHWLSFGCFPGFILIIACLSKVIHCCPRIAPNQKNPGKASSTGPTRGTCEPGRVPPGSGTYGQRRERAGGWQVQGDPGWLT